VDASIRAAVLACLALFQLHPHRSSKTASTMAFSLPSLPYDVSALEPYIDATTMTIHHDRHHDTYVNNLNAAVSKFPEFKDLGLVDLNASVGSDKLPAEIATAVRNNGGGHWNHSFFWKIMAGPTDSNGPSPALKGAIESTFGSLDQMQEKFNQAAATRFGSGWAWLGVKGDGTLAITSTPNQDNPLMSVADQAMKPILGLDVWEHAYYLKYQNKRVDYIKAWWNVVNWEQVSDFYLQATGGEIPNVL